MYGQQAYAAYRASAQQRSLISGAPLPDWAALPADIQTAWEAAGAAVIEAHGPPLHQAPEHNGGTLAAGEQSHEG
jgi:hypothetical protein